MENHAHSHSHSKSAPKAGNSLSSDELGKLTPAFDPIDPVRYQAARKSTWVSAIINLLLSVLQIVVGFFGKSQALMADGLHSLSDLLSDVLVLYANRHSSQRADAEHPYGHARIETAATLVLGISLALLGGALLIIAMLRLQQPAQIQAVHPLAFWVALLTLAAKEGLFRYLLSVAKRVRSQMLAANAWHSRSDAFSSLVVVVGIGGNLLGYYYLDLVAAAIVGGMIMHMGGGFAKTALSELIDTGLGEKEVEAIRETLLKSPGVLGVHDLRTRRMANNALVDAHVLVEPKISVSEGHYIAETARLAVLAQHHVLDVMVHIDPELDADELPHTDLPSRTVLLEHLALALGESWSAGNRVTLHYLQGKVDVDLFVDSRQTDQNALDTLQRKCDQLVAENTYFHAIHLHRSDARK